MLDRFTVLAAFAAILVVYIFWIDARPMVKKWRASMRHAGDLPILASKCRELGREIQSEIRVRNASAPSVFFAASGDNTAQMAAMDASSAYDRASFDIYSEGFQGKAMRLLQQLSALGATTDIPERSMPYRMQEMAVFFCAAGGALEDGDIEGVKSLAERFNQALRDEH